MLQALRVPLLAQASRPAFRAPGTYRSLSTTPRTLSSGPPLIYGSGAAPGAVPTSEEQATGLERLQLLGRMEGIDVFNMKKPEATKKGTMAEPIRISSLVR
jgi:cytochrome c oxidase subunit 5b